ncbi:MAG: hypothetical protein P8X97_04305 [Candidatus Bathyarchaeota archaeon]
MVYNEVRKDYLLNRWVVIAKERKKRPTDFVNNNKIANKGICPLCPGNEHMTPPAVLVYNFSEGKIKKEKDKKGFTFKDWSVRVIPNLYPVFKPPKQKNYEIKEKSTSAFQAIGHHEVIIESSCHEEHLGIARPSQIIQVIEAYLDRIKTLSKNNYVKHISIFRNYRPEAGASLAHPHSQLIATPCIPTILNQEKKASKMFWDKNCKCCFCDILDKEHSNMLDMSEMEKNDLAEVLRVSLGGLKDVVNDPPYNFGFHSLIDEKTTDYYHWHLEVYPRLNIWAGFEKSTGMFINVISPEDAALELRKSLKRNKDAKLFS